MGTVERLMDAAVADNELLVKNQELGDDAQIARDIEFHFYAQDEERAKLVASFVSDCRYGRPSISRTEHHGTVAWRLSVAINTLMTENLVMTLSAFVVCLSQLYGLEYDGWESDIKR